LAYIPLAGGGHKTFPSSSEEQAHDGSGPPSKGGKGGRTVTLLVSWGVMLWVIVLAPLCTLVGLAAFAGVAGSRGVYTCTLAGSSVALVSFMFYAVLTHIAPSTVARGGT
jgi:hypothetical protein